MGKKDKKALAPVRPVEGWLAGEMHFYVDGESRCGKFKDAYTRCDECETREAYKRKKEGD